MTPLTQADIEAEIMRLSSELEDETERYAVLSTDAAEAEADYKYAAAQRHMLMVDRHPKMPANQRERLIDSACDAEYRHYKLSAAKLDATKQALLSLRARLDATRTLSANVRAQT